METTIVVGPQKDERKYLSYQEIVEMRFKYKLILIADIFKALELICCPMMKETKNWYNDQFDLLIDQDSGELEGVLLNCQRIVKEIYKLY